MNKIKRFFKAFWRVEYRLSVWTNRGTLHNFSGESRDVVFSNARFLTVEGLDTCTWTLYKTGRFYLPEREIQRSTDKKL